MGEVQARGINFHVQRLGGPSDRTVVFLHGLVMDNMSSWYFTAANPMAERAEVLLYDLRGHGRTQRSESGYTVPEMVEDLAALLDACEVDRPVHLVGNSFGGLLAIAFALAHPERAASLVLVDAHISDEGWGAEMAGTLSLEGDERNAMIAESFKHWLGRRSERKRNKLGRAAEALVYETSLVADLQASEPFSEAGLSALPCPALAIYGQESDVLDRGLELARMLPYCELRILPGCTHSVLWEATEEVKSAIIDWVSAT